MALVSQPDLATSSPSVLALGRGAASMPDIVRRSIPQATFTTCEPDEPLPNARFDLILAIEAFGALDRDTALAMMSERVAPGGALVASDFVGVPSEQGASRCALEYSSERALADYDSRLARAGFSDIHVTDVTYETWYRFNKSSRIYFGSKLLLFHLEREGYEAILRALPGGDLIVDAYVVVRAAMPLQATAAADA